MTRKLKRKRFFIVAVAIFIVFLLSLIVLNTNRAVRISSEIWTLENQYKDVSIKDLNFDGKDYSIKNGKVIGNTDLNTKLKVLRFVAFYQWDREDPLFYSPDLDTQNLKSVTERMSVEQEKLLSIVKETIHVYPTDFLNAFSDVSSFTKKFLQNPSINDAKILIEKQKLSIRIPFFKNPRTYIVKGNYDENLKRLFQMILSWKKGEADASIK